MVTKFVRLFILGYFNHNTSLAASDAKALLDSFHSQNLLECTEQARLESELSNFRSIVVKAQRILRPPAVRLRHVFNCFSYLI